MNPRKPHLAVPTPPIVSEARWEAARQEMLVREKELTRTRDAVAAARRRMPWVEVKKDYSFDGPSGRVPLLELFEGRRQLLVYRAFFEPGVFGWPEHPCRGCAMIADQVAHVAHLNERDTTLAFASRASRPDIERVKARMGWQMPWYSMVPTDTAFDTDFGVHQWHGTNAFIRHGDRVYRTYFINNRGDGKHLELPRHHRAGPARRMGGLAGGISPEQTLRVVELARCLRAGSVGPVVERPGRGRPRRPRPRKRDATS